MTIITRTGLLIGWLIIFQYKNISCMIKCMVRFGEIVSAPNAEFVSKLVSVASLDQNFNFVLKVYCR